MFLRKVACMIQEIEWRRHNIRVGCAESQSIKAAKTKVQKRIASILAAPSFVSPHARETV
jgi:2C-methyl-D-erythritol 2,4-cyclodiphosphate synthase